MGLFDSISRSLNDVFGFDDQGVTAKAVSWARSQRRRELSNKFREQEEIDEVSRGEISDLFESGASNEVIADRIKAAARGEGLFGIRRRNQALREQREKAPGISQLLA